MKKIGLFKIVALLMGLHFCGVSVCTYDSDSIVIESESDAEGENENEDSKKDHKLISIHLNYSDKQTLAKRIDSIFTKSYWSVPHIEISSPPPELI